MTFSKYLASSELREGPGGYGILERLPGDYRLLERLPGDYRLLDRLSGDYRLLERLSGAFQRGLWSMVTVTAVIYLNVVLKKVLLDCYYV
jgi:hypothetical protein